MPPPRPARRVVDATPQPEVASVDPEPWINPKVMTGLKLGFSTAVVSTVVFLYIRERRLRKKHRTEVMRDKVEELYIQRLKDAGDEDELNRVLRLREERIRKDLPHNL